MKKTPDPEWYVYVSDFNKREIKTFNVFHSYNFLRGCKECFKKYKLPQQRDELVNEIRSCASYSFWSKCEYETVITDIFGRDGFQDKKIDVYQQLMLNWEPFIEYTIKHKAYFLRREKKEH